MKKSKYIIELAKGNMSIDGYGYIVSLLKYQIFVKRLINVKDIVGCFALFGIKFNYLLIQLTT